MSDSLGLMSLSLMDLEVLIKAGQPNDRKMQALPIFLDALLPAWGAILISVTLILAFGEIIPQSICSRYGLSIGARMAPLVRLLVICLPISYPASVKLLDLLLGKGHSALLRRAELNLWERRSLSHDETTIIAGALDLAQKTVKDAMTPMSRVFSLDLHSKLTNETMNLIITYLTFFNIFTGFIPPLGEEFDKCPEDDANQRSHYKEYTKGP
ncbi:hypothetical protein HAX54_008466 [Datura stramonium]|uniref:CNNM transmembrane domain-containing protein n=1 Tax=Datura stramonium TaxID=4076 RepID=A0ABS8TFU6_DATST|nr:hypothetical protein [Datura stramonium]